MYSTVKVMVCGQVGEATGAKRGYLFSYGGELSIADDDGVAERKDFPVALYAEVADHFTTPCDWVLFMSVCTGEKNC